MGKHRGGKGTDNLLGAIRAGRLDAVEEANAKERLRSQAGIPRGNRGAVKKLSMEIKSLRGQYDGFRAMVQEELDVSPPGPLLGGSIFGVVVQCEAGDGGRGVRQKSQPCAGVGMAGTASEVVNMGPTTVF